MYTGPYLRMVKRLYEHFGRNKHVFLFSKINEIHEFHKRKNRQSQEISVTFLMKVFYNKTKPLLHGNLRCSGPFCARSVRSVVFPAGSARSVVVPLVQPFSNLV